MTPTPTEHPEKVDFTQYEGKFSKEFFTQLRDNPQSITIQQMRENLYGYTCQEEYQRGEIPDWLMMDYWKDATLTPSNNRRKMPILQETLILNAIKSTGDGKSPETAYCVIHVHQEYEYIRRVPPYCFLQVRQQSVSRGIDCIEFQPNPYGIDCLYFDVRRMFELFYGSRR